MLEALVGLLVLTILAFLGTKAFTYVTDNHSEAKRNKAITDMTNQTAEWLSGLPIQELTTVANGYTIWSKPQPITNGKSFFRYRIVPNPTVASNSSHKTIGLQMEIGTMEAGVFQALDSYSTLIAPRSSVQEAEGVTKIEREKEISFYATHVQKIADVKSAAKAKNVEVLDSYQCYAPGECCDYMQSYFAGGYGQPAPTDGLNEKCHYRCALAGNIPIKGTGGWNSECNADFCALAPWKTADDCCKAIANNECPVGGMCHRICLECVGENGSGCVEEDTTKCQLPEWWFRWMSCKTLTNCEGEPISAEYQEYCKREACYKKKSDCKEYSTTKCCTDYWRVLKMGGNPAYAIKAWCSKNSQASQCCDIDYSHAYDWSAEGVYCGINGEVLASNRDRWGSEWYCPMPEDKDRCQMTAGCNSTFKPPNLPTKCKVYVAPEKTETKNSSPPPEDNTSTENKEEKTQTKATTGTTLPDFNSGIRKRFDRDGGSRNRPGGND